MQYINTKKTLLIIVTTIFLTVFIANTNYVGAVNDNSINLSARGAVLIDVDSGRILYQKNPDKVMRIASLTKIMTAIIAIEEGNLNSMVTTSNNAFGVEGSSIYLKKGEKLTLENMLYGLMLRSGNDAAVAIAEHIGGSVDGFVYLMNEKAAYIGMNNSHFTNPHGLDNDKHYSTPKDMAKLTAYAMKNETFRKIVSTSEKSAPMQGESWDRKWRNKNKLLYMYQWANGVKTGYTKLAKRCLSSAAAKDNLQLACITLNASDDWNDHMRLFEYGFNVYKEEKLCSSGDCMSSITIDGEEYEVITTKDFGYPLKEEEASKITTEIVLDKGENKLTINDKSKIGKIEFYLDDKYIGSSPLKLKEINK